MSTPSSISGPVTFAVTATNATSGQAGPGQPFGRGYEVHFKLSNGAVGSVFLPLATYNAANVEAAVREAARHMVEVMGIKGTV